MQYKEGIKSWLNSRKINDEILIKFGIKYEDRITIPINNEDGDFIYNKYRRNPLLPETGPKYWYDKGGKALLFGAEFIKDENVVVITEGELDALVLWSHNIPAVSSTGGAMTFNEEWVKLLEGKQVYICYDNDKAGCSGAVRTLTMIPHASVILLPNIGDLKDITDYYSIGGDLRNLMQSAKHYVSYEAVEKDKNSRKGELRSTLFHDAWMEWWDSEHIQSEVVSKPKESKVGDDAVARAKNVPIENLIEVNREHKALCLWHNEKHPSLHVYEDNHAFCFVCSKRADAIDIVREKHSLGFTEAVDYLNKM